MAKAFFIFFSLLFITGEVLADVAAKSYVDSELSKAVSTQESANQTLQGHYTVTGTIEVETPKLPTALN